jgi:hypothetical protein
VLQAIDQYEGLRIEQIAEKVDLSFDETREVVHRLWEENKIVSDADFTFERVREEPPQPK